MRHASNGRVLVVEDDADIRSLLRDLVELHGYDAVVVGDGRAALRALHAERPDLVLLDLGLPELDGWTALERIRDLSDVPVIVVTARSDEASKVRALKLGADDCVTKPFVAAELLARIGRLLRRARHGADAPRRLDDGRLVVDEGRREVTVDGRPVLVTPLEYRLLATLVERAGAVLSRRELLELVWDDPYGVSRDSVRLCIASLRRKLGAAVRIETVRGFGYRYRPPDDPPETG